MRTGRKLTGLAKPQFVRESSIAMLSSRHQPAISSRHYNETRDKFRIVLVKMHEHLLVSTCGWRRWSGGTARCPGRCGNPNGRGCTCSPQRNVFQNHLEAGAILLMYSCARQGQASCRSMKFPHVFFCKRGQCSHKSTQTQEQLSGAFI
jgi:hypothetical protein